MIEVSEVDSINARCKTELYDYTKTSWEKIKNDILTIEQAQFGELGDEENEFIKVFKNPNNLVVLMRDMQTNQVIGYTYAIPLLEADNEIITAIEREDKGEKTAYIYNIAFHPDYIGYHFRNLIKELEGQLKKRGYDFFEADLIAKDRNVRKIIPRIWGENVVWQDKELHDSPYGYGQQIFFRIKL